MRVVQVYVNTYSIYHDRLYLYFRTLEDRVLEYVDHLHEHFVYPGQ